MLTPKFSMPAASREAVAGVLYVPQGVGMPPRPGIEADDLVTPAQAARLLRVPANRVRVWISRYGVEPLGKLGRWNAYDYRELARIDADLRKREPAAA
jgi:hypothetical protein